MRLTEPTTKIWMKIKPHYQCQNFIGKTRVLWLSISEDSVTLACVTDSLPACDWQRIDGRFMELSIGGTFVLWNFRSLEPSFPGTFVCKSEISMELSFPNIDYYCTEQLNLPLACVICQRVTDRQTDSSTTARTGLCIAGYADACN